MEAPGSTIGPYRLTAPLGSGGMGSVWAAHKIGDSTGREVALKILHEGAMTPETVGRFEREREILGSLQHPSIARILDGGITEDGRPYFAMEKVDGVPIDRWCDEQSLTVDQRLGLAVDVAEAVGAAHAGHVVHRDLKPANILVDQRGRVRLLDFGVAKWTARALGADAFVTQGAARFMTPAFASPEQLAGGIVGPPSDVYSLGAMVHRLVVGVPPSTTTGDTTTGDPVAPSRLLGASDSDPDSRATLEAAAIRRGSSLRMLRRQVRGDLDHVLMTALAREPERRYADARDLATDLGRVLRREPVRAREGQPVARIARWVRRNRVGVGLASVSLLGLAGTLGWAAAEASEARLSALRSAQLREAHARAGARLRSTLGTTLSDTLGHLEGVQGVDRVQSGMVRFVLGVAKAQGDTALALAAAEAGLELAGRARGGEAQDLSEAELDLKRAEDSLDLADRLLRAATMRGQSLDLETERAAALRERLGPLRAQLARNEEKP